MTIASERPAPSRRAHRLSAGLLAAARRSLRAAAPALLLYVAARLLGLGALALWTGADLRASHGLHLLGTLWDANWYLDVARHGYDHQPQPRPPHHHPASNLAFFPLFPLAVRAVHAALPSLGWPTTGVLTACAASIAAAWGVFAATAVRYGRRAGTLTTVLWGVLPFAVLENMGYSEALFTALAAWSLWAVLRRRWLTAGLLCLLAGLTRPTGIAVAAAVVLAAAVEAVHLLRSRRARGLWRPVAAAVAAPLGWLGFIAWTGLRLGHWDGYFRVQRLWGSSFDFGAATLRDAGRVFGGDRPLTLGYLLVAWVLLAGLVCQAVALAHRQPLPFLCYSTVALVIALGDAAAFASRARFLLPVFPLLIPVATGLARVRSRAALAVLLLAAAGCSAVTGAYLVYALPTAP